MKNVQNPSYTSDDEYGMKGEASKRVFFLYFPDALREIVMVLSYILQFI